MTPEALKRLRKKLPSNYENKVSALSADDVKNEIVKLRRLIYATQKDMAEDPKLGDAKDKVSELEEPYKETMNACKNQLQYLCYELDDRGV